MFLNWQFSVFDDSKKFLHVEKFSITKAKWTITLLTIYAKETVFVASNYSFTSRAFSRLVGRIWCDHTLTIFHLLASSKLIYTFSVHAKAKSFFWSSEHHQILSQHLHYFLGTVSDFTGIEVFEAFVLSEIFSHEIFVAYLALNHYIWALSLDMLE